MPKPFFEDKAKKLQEIIRVNHAGEFGAAEIYKGQIRYTKNPSDIKLLTHMLKQEKEHLDYFSNKIKEGHSRPTILMPIWKIAGYLMGVISAKISIKSAMLVTENVETVIEDHYQEQIDYLQKFDAKNPMLAKIKKFQADEVEHKNEAIRHCEKLKSHNVIARSEATKQSQGIRRDYSPPHEIATPTMWARNDNLHLYPAFIQAACKIAIHLSKKF